MRTPPSRSRSPLPVVSAVALALALTACGPDGAEPTGGAGDDPFDLPAVRDSAVVEVDREGDGTEVIRAAVVDMDPDASTEEVTAVLEALEATQGDGEVDDTRLYLGAGEVDYVADLSGAGVTGVLGGAPGTAPPPAESAELLLAGVGTSADVTVVGADGSGAPYVELAVPAAGEPDVAAVGALAQEVAADPLLAGSVSVVRATSTETTGVAALRPGSDGLTTELAQEWDALSAATDDLGDRLRLNEAGLDPDDTLGEGQVSVDVIAEDLTRIPPEDLTVATYAADLDPMLQGLAEVLAAQPDGSTLVVSQADGTDVIVDIRNDRRPPATDDLGRSWGTRTFGFLPGR